MPVIFCTLSNAVEWTRDVPDIVLDTRINHRGIQIAKQESAVRYLGIELDDALELAEQTEV